MRLAACWWTVLMLALASTGCDDRPKDSIPTKIEPAAKFEPKPGGDRGRSGD